MPRVKYLVILTIVVYFSTCSYSANRTKGEKLSKHKGSVKTIYSSHGEIVDCVNFYDQPAFDHPLLKDKKHHHKQEIPEFIRNKSSQISSFKNSTTYQTWHQSEKCSNGTVPILRQPKNNNDILRKQKRFASQVVQDAWKRKYAIVQIDGHRYYGASGTFNIWKPFVEEGDFSLSQMWLHNNEGISETIEAGWHVFHYMYGESREDPRLFTYWTVDDYEDTGCYNLECPGFVHLGQSHWVLGGQLVYSEIDSIQFNLAIVIRRNPRTRDWLLIVGSDIVGYWPSALFQRLHRYANTVDWGGEVFNDNPIKDYHTRTEMGSGRFANEGFRKAAHIYSLKTLQQRSGRFVDQPIQQTTVTHPNSYTLQVNHIGNPLSGYSFFYGGPGYHIPNEI